MKLWWQKLKLNCSWNCPFCKQKYSSQIDYEILMGYLCYNCNLSRGTSIFTDYYYNGKNYTADNLLKLINMKFFL